jgi:GNAT superfamily N-acetyltransferase
MEQCRSLWKELTEWHRSIYEDPTIGGENPEDYFDDHLAKVGPESLWVAVHGDIVVGLVGLIPAAEEAEIEPLIVSKDYRKKGVGEKLVKTVVSEARNLGVKLLNVKPVGRNIRAIRFLYKRGFKNLGQIELFLDLSGHKWESGPELFGCKFSF